jgi:histone H3/H4
MNSEKQVSKNVEKSKSIRKVHKKQRGFDVYIQKVLKQVHPDTRISTKASYQMNKLLELLGGELVQKAHFFAAQSNVITITSREIQSSVRMIIPGELGKHVVSEGVKAVTKWNADNVVNKPQKGKKPKERSERRAGLTFSVSRCRKLIEMKGTSGCRIGKGAPIYLAATLEYICAELLELSGDTARDNRKVTISTRHIFLCISNDQELHSLFKAMNVDLDAGGVTTRINENLLPKSTETKDGKTKTLKKKSGTKKSKSSTKNGEKVFKPHRFRPGTVALREIRKQQKATDLAFRKKPFDRIVREILKSDRVGSHPEMRFSGGSILMLQGFIEMTLVHIYQNSNDLAIYCGRQGVCQKDILFSLNHSSFDTSKLNIPTEPMTKDQITNAALTRVARRAGIKRLRDDVYNYSRGIIHGLIEMIIKSSVVIVQHKRQKTISVDTMRASIACEGFNYI